MNEKIKKVFYSFLYRLAAAVCIFALLMLLKRSAPEIFEKCSAAWKRNADLKAAAGYIKSFLGEIIPF